MCIEYCIYVNMYHVSVQGIDERMVNVHYYYLTEPRSVAGARTTVLRHIAIEPCTEILKLQQHEQCRQRYFSISVSDGHDKAEGQNILFSYC